MSADETNGEPFMPTKGERKVARVRENAWKAANSRSKNSAWMAGFVAGALWYRATNGNEAHHPTAASAEAAREAGR
ncbi:hypothetical protein [Microbacterium sp. KNMS]